MLKRLEEDPFDLAQAHWRENYSHHNRAGMHPSMGEALLKLADHGHLTRDDSLLEMSWGPGRTADFCEIATMSRVSVVTNDVMVNTYRRLFPRRAIQHRLSCQIISAMPESRPCGLLVVGAGVIAFANPQLTPRIVDGVREAIEDGKFAIFSFFDADALQMMHARKGNYFTYTTPGWTTELVEMLLAENGFRPSIHYVEPDDECLYHILARAV